MDIKEQEKHILNNVLKNLIFKQGRKKYISKDSFNTLELTKNERLFLLQVLDRNKIKLVDVKRKNINSFLKSEKDKKKSNAEVNNFITKDDRTRLIERYTFGEIGEIEYQEHDIPVRALLEYDDFGNLIYEDYSELDTYIEEVLIPKYVSHNKRYNYEIEDYEYIPTIQLYNIIKWR